MRKRITRPNSPDSLYRKGTSGEYNLQIKSVTEMPGKYEYVLIDADLHEYKVITTVLYPVGKLLRCMVRFKIKKGSLLLEKIGICREQKRHLIPRPKNEKDNRHKVKKCNTNTDVNKNVEADIVTIVEDVKKLIEARESGLTNAQLKSEVMRLRQIIVDGHLQDIVVEECGKESLKKVFTMARSLRRAAKKKWDKQWLTEKNDTPENRLDKALRDKWLEWLKGMYGPNGATNMERRLYNAIRKSAYYLNYVELMNECGVEARFFQTGLERCQKIAINLKIYKTSNTSNNKPKLEKKKRTRTNNAITGSPHITRKDWGSAYRPGRG